MIRFLLALGISIALHALLAVALGVYFDYAPLPELPRLDLSAVELSFANDEVDTATIAPFPVSEPELSPLGSEPEPSPPTEPEQPIPESDPEPASMPPEPEPEPPPPAEPEPAPPSPEPEPEPPPPTESEPPAPEPPPLEPTTAQARIDAPPSAMKPIRPVYPMGARQRGEEGDVNLLLSINAKGHVTAASVHSSSGYPELDIAALRAAKKARFVPARAGHKAVPADARITIEFRLSQ